LAGLAAAFDFFVEFREFFKQERESFLFAVIGF
jgi:hypothetical protein